MGVGSEKPQRRMSWSSRSSETPHAKSTKSLLLDMDEQRPKLVMGVNEVVITL